MSLDDFILDCEKRLEKALEREGFKIKNRCIKSGQTETFLEFEVEDLDFLIADDTLAFGGRFIRRHYEFYKGADKEYLIKEFIDSCIFFLKHPEMRDKPSLFNLKKTFRCFLSGLGVHIPIEKYKKDLIKKSIQ